MFGISIGKASGRVETVPPAAMDQASLDLLARFCVVDHWWGDLDNAALSLGEAACRFHGLDPRAPRFGLLEFVRSYESRASYEIINLFERAAAEGRPFQYCADIKSTTLEKKAVHCFGDFTETADGSGRRGLTGVFLLPRREFLQCDDAFRTHR